MRISDWSSDVCSSDLAGFGYYATLIGVFVTSLYSFRVYFLVFHGKERFDAHADAGHGHGHDAHDDHGHHGGAPKESPRSEEHTSELQSLMRISYAVFCLKKKKTTNHNTTQI